MASNQFPITVPGISESFLCLGAFQQVGLGGEMGRGGVSSGVGQKQYEGGRHVKYHMVIRFRKCTSGTQSRSRLAAHLIRCHMTLSIFTPVLIFSFKKSRILAHQTIKKSSPTRSTQDGSRTPKEEE
jgi:hypothetical protein